MYLSLSRQLRRPRFHADPGFQKAFNHFYRVRRNEVWRTEYFRLLGQAARRPISFRAALSRLVKVTGRYEASFTSKLIATIDPSQPVIDSVVLQNLQLRLPGRTVARRIHAIQALHGRLTMEYHEFLRTARGRYLVRSFKRMYPGTRVSPVKMLDFVLWQTR